MKWIWGILAVLGACVLIGLAGLYSTGNEGLIRLVAGYMFGAPSGKFDAAQTAVAPDYADKVNWAALPGSPDLADFTPEGVEPRDLSERAPVDVFFIHPTGYLSGESWTSPMHSESKTEENTKWMMANQASVYNGCCNVYAPRYREASIFTYFAASPEEKQRIMRFAYTDVLNAFEYYLEHYNMGRPFILASHSQGTHHGVVLLRERIDKTLLAKRMVVAYLIGGGLANAEFNGMNDISICNEATQLQCVNHWDTMSEQAEAEPLRADNLCVNPLSWRRDSVLANESDHVGGVPPSGRFQVEFFNDEPTGVEFLPLTKPVPNHVHAQCEDGVLYVTHQEGSEFDSIGGTPGNTNYHGLDYPLFYMDIRENAILRVESYLQSEVVQ